MSYFTIQTYHKTSNTRRTLPVSKLVDHSNVVAAMPVGNIFILDLTPEFNGLGKDKCKTIWKPFKFSDLVLAIFEILR